LGKICIIIVKIISRNVNGIRAIAKKWFQDFVKEQNPDVLCIQETKAFEEQYIIEVWVLEGYKHIWHSWVKPWYAWVATFFKEDIEIISAKNHFWETEHFHDHWRVVETKFKNFTLINVYFPNWWTKADWTEMLSYKLEFYDKMIDYCNKLVEQWESVIITWDFNICHTEIDIARPKENKNSIWFLPIERKKFWEFLSNWYIDVFRYFNPWLKWYYTWWSYRWWARKRNIWRRLDYFIFSKDLIWKVKKIEHLDQQMWSDHCPILMEIDL